MRKGVILEINDLYLTLLTPEGEFLRARKLQQDYQVGEEIHFFPESEKAKRRKLDVSFLTSLKARSIMLAAALMLVMAAILPVYQDGQVYAYMSIDVNPSIEMAVNDDLKVLQMEGYNPEGKQIITELEGWKKKDAALVAEMILDKIEAQGYFSNKNEVVIATVHKTKAKKSVDRKLEQKIAEIKKSTTDEDLNLKVMEATNEDREKAVKQGVTTGVYKEKQKTAAPKPVEKEKKAEPKKEKKEPIQQPVRQEPEPEQKRKEAPGQVKKDKPEPPKGNSNSEQRRNPASDKKNEKDNSNSGSNGNGQSNKKHATNRSSKPDPSGQKYKNDKKPNVNQNQNNGQRGKAGNPKDNSGKK
ncbi:anti-sigma factor domain-containing protein [Bacillus sp. ISL-35]|uniref:anti-sigma factor domain-containing protein n=1 Tax=Bacillus sp. ISL-35 TaxID=2819122 RepID=UPI001BE4EC0A|nr:anti-sigma factor domain-containing protein [Bacillus sp. ISL-35]MBT2678325.1 anti-sigma factor domain-containing protein [Bacillus sp. ISL-35]MBT2705951.1 anti-sigma factor domain-containing protein [Chryseobacterium sp. ISL-80]